tara:strand:- start:342 stop:1007 length:666 start_codon:yes stop_codon:yes gene_type:complete
MTFKDLVLEKKNDTLHYETANLFEIPPVLIFPYKGKDLNSLAKYVLNLDYRSPDFNQSAKSSNFNLLDDDKLVNLKNFFLKAVNQYSRVVCGSNQEIGIQQSWSNLSKKEEGHTEHYHTNSYLSGVFYLMNEPEIPIIFHSGSSIEREWFSVIPDQTEDGWYNCRAESVGMEALPGSLLVFSSRLKHSVPPNDTDKKRLSLSFNTFPKLPFGNEHGLTHIK